MEYITSSFEETKIIGKYIGSMLTSGDIVILYGDLGAGKTTLTKGIAAGLGVEKDVTSPTFGLMNVYEITNDKIRNFVHIDTYRLKDEKELQAIGVEEYLGEAGTICVIEWPEKVERLLAEKKVKRIYLEHQGDEKRKITFEDV